jgi:hypothetical protein
MPLLKMGSSRLNATILATLFTIFLTISIAGCTQSAEKPGRQPQIKILPPAGSYLPKYQRFATVYEKTNLLLLNFSVRITTAEKGYGSTFDREKPYEIMSGDPVIIIEGVVRNQDEEKEYVVLTARGYDSSGKEMARSYLGAPGTAPWMGDYFRLGKGEEGKFRLVLKYDDRISTVRIFANLYNMPVP